MRGWFSDVLDDETKSEKNDVEVSENYLKKSFGKLFVLLSETIITHRRFKLMAAMLKRLL
jgi:hypothetical protein